MLGQLSPDPNRKPISEIVNLCDNIPSNGKVFSGVVKSSEPAHSITVENGSSGDAIVKIKDTIKKRTIAAFYVKEKNKASFHNVPDGNYIIQFANGTKLNKTCNSFLDGIYSQFDGYQKLSTKHEGNMIYTQELVFTLFPAANGNIDIDKINPSDF